MSLLTNIDGDWALQNHVTSESNGHALWQTPIEKVKKIEITQWRSHKITQH